MKNEKNLAFSKGMPSAFIVGSPLQLLCAIEAEHEFEITIKKYVLILRPNWPRNEQVLSMAKSFNIDYDVAYTDDLTTEEIKTKSHFFADIETCLKYDRVFIGEYYDYYMRAAAYKYSHKGTLLMYLDDGNASIAFLKGVSDVPRPRVLRKKIRWYISEKNRREKFVKPYIELYNAAGIINSNYYFTIFDSVKSKRFITYSNTFANLRKDMEHPRDDKSILIIGPIFERGIELYNIDEGEFEAIMWKKMVEVRKEHPHLPILFIPHGRDVNKHIPQFCKMLDVEYKKIPEAAEWFLMKSNIMPIAVYGQCSSALYTIKKIFPEARVVNWFLYKKYDNPNFIVEQRKAKEYVKIGIEEDRIQFPCPSLFQKWMYFKEDVLSLFGWLKGNIK